MHETGLNAIFIWGAPFNRRSWVNVPLKNANEIFHHWHSDGTGHTLLIKIIHIGEKFQLDIFDTLDTQSIF